MDALPATSVTATPTRDASLSLRWVDDDRDFLDRAAGSLADDPEVDVQTVTSSTVATGNLDGIDCVVSEYDLPDGDGLDVLSAVRECQAGLPVVLCTATPPAAFVDDVRAADRVEYVRKEDTHVTVSLVATRARRLVADRRTAALARRALAGLDEASDGLAVARPDDRFAVVNRAFARRFGQRRGDLLGRDWRRCFPDHEVDRLETTALETVAEDWQWTGGCTGRRADGETFTAQTRIAGLDDGSVVFCVADPADGS